jgi:two-component system response regulator FixJ
MSGGKAPRRRAYVIDDDDAFRHSLVVLLESAGWTVDAFASADRFAGRSAELEPGIVLLDLNLGGCSGLDLIEGGGGDVMERFAVVMMTGAGEVSTAVRSIKAGAVDFVEKPFAAAELLDRLGAVDAELAQTLKSKAARWDACRRVAALSGRERDVLERLLSGSSNKLIARDLELSPRTVEMHRARMLDKLGARTTAEALDLGRLAGVTPVAAPTPAPRKVT